VVAGIAGAIAYHRFGAVRLFLTALSPAIVVFPAAFLFASPVARVVFPGGVAEVGGMPARAPVPVVFVVFDELSVTSLMDASGSIDAVRYPNFAALARQATWYRNATTVSDSTVVSLPAILTGSYPRGPSLPSASDHPRNLFTWLAGAYGLRVFEPLTQLCPPRLCAVRVPERLGGRLRALFEDATAVYLHVLLPPAFRSGWPDVRQQWTDLLAPSEGGEGNPTGGASDHPGTPREWEGPPQRDRVEAFAEFVDAVGPTTPPTLFFLHSLLPHTPYKYLPSGRLYREPLLPHVREQWPDEAAASLAHQRYLLQVAFVDTLLGRLLRRLHAVDLYQSSLLVVTSDHGSCFGAGQTHRHLEDTNHEDILPVPLFIKEPHQRTAAVSDRNVETIDILPTIADILGTHVPWPVDGHSARGPAPARSEKVAFRGWSQRTYPATLPGRERSLARQIGRFGAGTPAADLFAIGPFRALLRRPLRDLAVTAGTSYTVEIEGSTSYKRVDPRRRLVPVPIRGRLRPADPAGADPILAVAVNGVVHAVVPASRSPEGELSFAALVPDGAFRPGRNDVDVLVVAEDGTIARLARATPPD
jgi:hypothetical protein